jgi:hypothetical protein
MRTPSGGGMPRERTGPLGGNGPVAVAGEDASGAPAIMHPVELRPQRRRGLWLVLAAMLASCLCGACLVAVLGAGIRRPGDTCARARACCEYYRDTLFRSAVRDRCEEVNLTDEEPEEWCLVVLNQYRATLIRNHRPVPATCEAPPRSWIE